MLDYYSTRNGIAADNPIQYQEYFVSLIPQTMLKQAVHFSDSSKPSIPIAAPAITNTLPTQQPTYPPTDPVDLRTFGEVVQAPLGHIVHARAGDKGSNCNVGFFVRNENEWDWLRSFLTIGRIIELLAEDFIGQRIDRMEFPNLWAVHFLLVRIGHKLIDEHPADQTQHDHLDRGVNANATYDILGKFLSEYLRCKLVDVPKKFLDRGKI